MSDVDDRQDAHGDDAAPVAQTPALAPEVSGPTTAPPRGAHAMAIVRWALVVMMAGAAAASIGLWAGWFTPVADGSDAATQYICPMHPAVIQDHPGTCPICSMDLVLKEAPDVASASDGVASAPPAPSAAPVAGLVPVELTPDRIQLAGLRTARVERTTLAPELRAVGTLSATEHGLAQVHTRVSGWIEQLLVEETGQRVKKGQVLARLYSPELLAAQQELLTAQRWNGTPGAAPEAGGVGPGLSEGARRRLELLDVSPGEIDEVVRTRKPLRAIAIRSPVTGHVTRRSVVQGQYVQPGSPLFELADLSKLWALVDVPEHEVERVALGARARVVLAAFAGRRIEGKVDFIYPSVAEDARTLRLRIALDNADLTLRPGMSGEVYVEASANAALVVPAEAVVDTGTAQYVFVALPGGRFEPRRVKLGLTAGDSIQVLEGIAEGDTVVTTGNFLIDSESRLQAAISGEPAPEAEAAAPAAPDAPATPAAVPAVAAPPRAAPAPVAPSTPKVAATPPAPPTPPATRPPPRPASACDREIDRAKFPDKHRQCLACEVQHRGMGSMVDDCKRAIAQPWR